MLAVTLLLLIFCLQLAQCVWEDGYAATKNPKVWFHVVSMGFLISLTLTI